MSKKDDNPVRNDGSQGESVSNGTGKSVSALREEEVLKFWRENGIFEKSLKKESPHGDYIFYEGPPTANGKPGIHHLEARAFKDIIPRYKTMQGYHVRRKGGWDTHGLPVELQVEKKLGLSSKKAIEEYGIAKFNHECKESVWKYTDLWEKFTERIGYWLDQKNPYVTYHNNYIESVWNVIKEVNNQKLLYKDYKVVPWCPRCGTVLSSHELAQGYQDVKDLSVYVKFKVKNGSKVGLPEENTYILAWTTTPWTLPGNVALAVNKKIEYCAWSDKNESGITETYVVSKEYFNKTGIQAVTLSIVLNGKDLIGLEYEPLYPYLSNTIPDSEKPKLEKAFKIYGADFVTTEDGTGVVHTAVMYGQDDFELGTKIGLPKHHLVGLNGKFLAGTDFLEGRFVRDEEVAVDIIKDLAHRGLLFKKEKYEHSYPHCWRCKTALIYYARDSWYIRMTELRNKMVKENESINWEPSYIKEGRFGEWLRDIKDWAISRERYWGTPLPVWTCDKCKKINVIGSIEDLKSRTKKSGNKYFVMRHGQAGNNVEENFYMDSQVNATLTEFGKEQVLKSINNFNEKIDVIISSPFLRAKQTTEIVSKEIEFPAEKIIYNKCLREWEIGNGFEGKTKIEVAQYYEHDYVHAPNKKVMNGESFAELIKRVGDFIYEVNSKYENKNIFISCHGGVSAAFQFITNGFSFFDLENQGPIKEFDNAEIRELDFTPLSHNEVYELDLHKPYIDEVELFCDCGGKLTRTKEVMDVWLDSGAMPFAQNHYPFEKNDLQYPADFICEAIDQTRGWFYTLHAVGVIMGRGKAYKNVICLGHLLDAKGKKMSKSLGNIVDPLTMIDKYGADTLRLWMYSINQPGESKNFDEKTVSELHNKVFNLLYNVFAFYELYRDKNLEVNFSSPTTKIESENVLDKWIITLLNKLTEDVTKNLDNYKLLEPVRAIRDFIDDLSTWYLRRSRERIKNGDVEAKQTLYYVLKTLIKLMAPFTPFASEDIWQKLKIPDDKESVHLIEWPKVGKIDEDLLLKMEQTKLATSHGLWARQDKNIRVRQPLSELKLNADFVLSKELENIVKEEVNVKKITFESDKNIITNLKNNKNWFVYDDFGTLQLALALDTHITEELKKEGQYRELLRAIQDIRKKNGLNPNDMVTIVIETDTDGQELINKFKKELMKAVSAKEIQIKENEGETKSNKVESPDASEEAFREIKIDELIFVINII